MSDNYKYSNQDYIKELLAHDKTYHATVLSYIENNISKECKILDFGCGTGNLIKILNDLGYSNSIGVDLDSDTIKSGRSSNFIENIYTLTEKKLLDNSFDLVLSYNVIEHVDNVDVFLNRLSELVSNEGVIFIVTPNYLDPKNYLSYIKSKVLKKEMHLKPFNDGGVVWLFGMLIKSVVLTVLKLMGLNKKLWLVTPLSPSVSLGGDADATWVSNYLDISRLMKKRGFIDVKKVGILKKLSTNIYIGVRDKRC